jgi:hypothetical protein
VAAGQNHSLALKADGGLYAWGLNQYGQLGTGTITSTTPNPTATGTALPTRSTAAGSNFGLAVRGDGTLWAWGDNAYGQLGTGTTTAALKPVQVGTDKDCAQVGAGTSHGLGLKANGSLWAWGNNYYGQLGTTTNSSSPVQEATAGTAWLMVSGGGTHSLARTSYGPNFFSTGDNTFGQLGDGTTTQSLVYTRTGDPDGQPLPVELTQFTATPAGPTGYNPAAVRLAWATASEKNSQQFAVERSLDGEQFAAIGTVGAAGSSGSARAYALLDAQLPTGAALLYYRLKQLDADGTAAYSPVRTVALTATGLALYPNPARGGAATLTGAQPGTAVTVFDALGRPVTATTADAAGTAALALPAGTPAGVYVVRAGARAVPLTVE